ncbi:unnamed protein product, partial [Mesorhabditis belari]|uniref:Major facilitator superfamily (MFS) profile domain-containing protein n=1 Tax=Mesorhabditis belari TaxID=2138241 RepID=A0AAF3EDZ8_9BILA
MPNPSSTQRHVAPDGGWGWAVVLGAFLIHVISDGFIYSLGIVMDHLKEEFHSDNASAALVFSVLNAVYMASGVVATAIADRIGCQLTCAIGCLFSALGCLLSIWASSMLLVGVTIGVILGIGSGLMYCPAIVCMTTYFDKKRSLATGITVCGAGVGAFLFSPINALVIDHFGYKGVFILFTGLFVFCLLFAATFKPIPKQISQEVEDRTLLSEKSSAAFTMTEIEEKEHGLNHWLRKTISLLRDPVLLVFGFSCMMTSVGTNGPIYFLPFYATNTLGLTRDQSSVPLSIYGLINTLGRLVCGFISDRRIPLPKKAGDNKARNRRYILGGSLVLCGLFCCLSFLLSDFLSVCLYAGLFGYFSAASICLMSVVLVDLVGIEKLTNSFGIILTFKAIGTMIGPSIAGWLADYFGSYHPSYIFSGISLSIAGLLLTLIPLFKKK